MNTDEILKAGLPVVEQVSDALREAVAGGQPVLLVHDGEPAAVVLDWESWQEVEELTRGECEGACDVDRTEVGHTAYGVEHHGVGTERME